MGTIDIVDLRGNSPMQVAFEIPTLSREVADQRSTVSRLQIEGSLSLLQTEVSYVGQPVPTMKFGNATIIKLAMGGEPYEIVLDVDLCELLALYPNGTRIKRSLSADLFAMAVEHVLTEDIEKFEAAYARPIEVTQVKLGAEFDPKAAVFALKLRLSALEDVLDGGAVTAVINGSNPSELVGRLTSTFQRKPSRGLEKIKVQLSYVGPLSCMPKSAMNGLAVGDVLDICPEWKNLSEHVNLIIRNETVIPLRRGESGFVATEQGQSLSKLRQQFEDGASDLSTENQLKRVNDPLAVVTVELQRSEVNISSLSDIQNGDVLDFDIESVDQIHVCVDGTPIAAGRLVQLEESYGVQITKLL